MQINEVVTRLAASQKLLENAMLANRLINAKVEVVVKPATWLSVAKTEKRLAPADGRLASAMSAHVDIHAALHQLQQVADAGGLDAGSHTLKTAHEDVTSAIAYLERNGYDSGHWQEQYAPVNNLITASKTIRVFNSDVDDKSHTPSLHLAYEHTVGALEALRFDSAASSSRNAEIDAALARIAAQDAPALARANHLQAADDGLADVFASAASGHRAIGA